MVCICTIYFLYTIYNAHLLIHSVEKFQWSNHGKWLGSSLWNLMLWNLMHLPFKMPQDLPLVFVLVGMHFSTNTKSWCDDTENYTHTHTHKHIMCSVCTREKQNPHGDFQVKTTQTGNPKLCNFPSHTQALRVKRPAPFREWCLFVSLWCFGSNMLSSAWSQSPNFGEQCNKITFNSVPPF